jgi:metallo-beta-lactamase family protein
VSDVGEHPTCGEETQTFLKRNGSPLEFSSLTYTRSVEESKAINEKRGPLVIISASGMCESGRILHHLRNNIANPRNTILIVSWQAENTLGRRLADHAKEVKIFGDPTVRAWWPINGYSGHAGHDLLVRWGKALLPRVKKTFLVHGEPAALKALQLALHVEGLPDVYAPQLHETVEI